MSFLKSSNIEFDTSDDPRKVMATVQERGAAVIHDYIPTEMIARIADELRAEPMALDEDLSAPIRRRQEMVKYALKGDPLAPPLEGTTRQAPLGIEIESRGIAHFVSKDGGYEWHPNEIMGHLYRTNYFIDEHQDLTSARRAIASATVAGRQKFFIRLDGDRRETMVQTEKGMVIIMRGYNDDDPELRPRHRVEAPEEPRLALTIREVGALAAKLPQWDKKDNAPAVW